jgi:hypothetical protein
MKSEEHIDLITGYLQGTLNAAENERLQILLEEGKVDISELIELQKVYNEMEILKVLEPEPGSRIRQNFYSMLEKEKAKQAQAKSITEWATEWIHRVKSGFELRNLGYATAIFMIGLLFGDLLNPISNREDKIDRLSSEVSQMREVMMISLLENDSPVERLRAVNISNQIPSSGNRTVDALLHTLNNDTNVNVRIAAVNALSERGSNPEVRSGLVNSIVRQESPLVQIALADAMIELQERRAVEEFEILLARNNMDSSVRDKLENTILALL